MCHYPHFSGDVRAGRNSSKLCQFQFFVICNILCTRGLFVVHEKLKKYFMNLCKPLPGLLLMMVSDFLHPSIACDGYLMYATRKKYSGLQTTTVKIFWKHKYHAGIYNNILVTHGRLRGQSDKANGKHEVSHICWTQ